MPIINLNDEKTKWLVFFSVFFSGALIIGLNTYSFGLFIEPLEDEFGWSREQISLGYSVSFVSSLLAPIIGKFVDIKGTKVFLVGSLFLIAFGFILRPFMTSLNHWIILNSMVFAGYPGTLLLASGILMQVWFPKSRGRMVAFATSGHNLGGLTIPFITLLLLFYFNWKFAYVFFGSLIFIVALFSFFFVKNSPRNANTSEENIQGVGIDFKNAIKTKKFVFLTLGLTFAMVTYNGVMPQMAPHLQTEGLSLIGATIAMGYIGAMVILSKLFFGRLSERYSSIIMTCFSVFLQAIGLIIILLSSGNIVGIWSGLVIFGIGFGGLGALIPLNITECFGMKSLGTIFGALSFLGVWAAVSAPWMMGRIFDSTSSYRNAHAIVIVVFFIAIFFLLLARFLNKRNYLLN
jgi:MFS family permease